MSSIFTTLLVSFITLIYAQTDCDFVSPSCGPATNLVCDELGGCQFNSLVCSPNLDCFIVCIETGACKDSTISGSSANDVSLTCGAPIGSCQDATLYCGSGKCYLECLDLTSCWHIAVDLTSNPISFNCGPTALNNCPLDIPSPFSRTTLTPVTAQPTTNQPSTMPTNVPSVTITNQPSTIPTNVPSVTITIQPTKIPSQSPFTNVPTTLQSTNIQTTTTPTNIASVIITNTLSTIQPTIIPSQSPFTNIPTTLQPTTLKPMTAVPTYTNVHHREEEQQIVSTEKEIDLYTNEPNGGILSIMVYIFVTMIGVVLVIVCILLMLWRIKYRKRYAHNVKQINSKREMTKIGCQSKMTSQSIITTINGESQLTKRQSIVTDGNVNIKFDDVNGDLDTSNGIHPNIKGLTLAEYDKGNVYDEGRKGIEENTCKHSKGNSEDLYGSELVVSTTKGNVTEGNVIEGIVTDGNV